MWSLKDPAHHIPNQTEIATEEFCPKSLLRKQNEIDFIESHFQILHHLKKKDLRRKLAQFSVQTRMETKTKKGLQDKPVEFLAGL